MKNNYASRSSIFMRALLVLLFMTVSAQWSFAQLNLNVSRTTLGTVIEQIKSQSKYQFFYDDKLATLPIENVKVKGASIESALQVILKGTNISFKVEDNIVYLSEKSKIKQDSKQLNKERKVIGRVVDEHGESLIGVNVLVKGTSSGAITDLDGNFIVLTNEATPTIRFSYVGYKQQEVTVKDGASLSIVMQTDAQLIEEVVVTALGIKRSEKALSYNVQQVAQSELVTVKDANFVNALNGKIAGVNINTSSSGVGGASKVVMRGTKGIDQSSNALYVIDGVPMYNSAKKAGTEFDSVGATEAIADINPEDIESVSVLTGAAAAAMYGSNASNGAIVITTKKGKSGRASLTVSSNTEIINAFVMPRFQNRYGTGVLGTMDDSGTKSWGMPIKRENYKGYTPDNNYFQTGVVSNQTVSFTTGTERNQTYLSANAVNSRGIIPNNGYNRYNFTLRNTTSFLDDRMTLDLGATYVKQDDRNMTNQGTYTNPLVTAYLFPRGDDWNAAKMFERYDPTRKLMLQYFPQEFKELNGQNPYWINYRNLRENNRSRYMFNANLSYRILDWLSVSGRVRVDNSTNDFTEKFFASTEKVTAEGSNNGLYGIATSKDSQTYSDVLLNINKQITELLTFNANFGASISDMQYDELKIRGPIDDRGLANVFNVMHLNDATTRREQSGWHDQTQSVFGSVELGYKNAYYLTVTGRNDWASQLAGPNSVNSSFFYPSFGGSIVLSEIIKMPKQISYLKLRGSWASVGLPFARFLARNSYMWNNSQKIWETTSHYPMGELKPERTRSLEFGITTRFLQHFNLDISYYNTRTYNQTFDPQISVSSGYNKLYVQTGNVQNQGVELSLGYRNTWNKFSWGSNFTFNANQNKILELVDNYKHPETGLIINKDRLDVGGLGQAHFILKKGGTLGDLYSLMSLKKDDNGMIYVNDKGELGIDAKAGDLKLGSVFPKANMAWRNDFDYQDFSVGFMLSARIGGIVYSATQAALDFYGVSENSAKARDNGGVIINGGDRISAYQWYTTIGGQGTGIPQYYTYSATNLRLAEANISYTLPRKLIGNFMQITVSVVGRNLWMIYKKAPFDPESVATTGNYYQGIDNFMMPSTRNIGFNIRLKL